MGAIAFEPMPGAIETVAGLRARGLELAVVSNWDVGLAEHLQRIDAASFFSAIVTSAEAGAAKPDPAVFQLALERLGVQPGRALHVGDEPEDEEAHRPRGCASRMPHWPRRSRAGREGARPGPPEGLGRDGRGGLAALGYASRASGGKPPKDAAYQWSTAASGVVQYGIILAVVLAITRPDWSLLALRRPRFLLRVSAAVVLVFVAVYGRSAVVAAYTDPGREQGLTPDHWDSHRAAQFVVNFVVFVAAAVRARLLLARAARAGHGGPWRIGVAFGLAHGLVEGLPILIVFGAGLAVIRSQSKSVYPGMIVHGMFNAIALIVSVAT